MEKIDINIFIANLRATTTVLQQLHYLIEGHKEDVRYINALIDDYNDLLDKYNDIITDLSNYYTKNQIDTIIDNINSELNLKADKSTTYTKTEVDSALDLKADKSTTYTKTEVDSALDLKANKSTTYTKTEVDSALDLKADKSTTYTKTETNTLLNGKQEKLESGINIKTINGNSILGSGDLEISSGGSQLYQHTINVLIPSSAALTARLIIIQFINTESTAITNFNDVISKLFALYRTQTVACTGYLYDGSTYNKVLVLNCSVYVSSYREITFGGVTASVQGFNPVSITVSSTSVDFTTYTVTDKVTTL